MTPLRISTPPSKETATNWGGCPPDSSAGRSAPGWSRAGIVTLGSRDAADNGASAGTRPTALSAGPAGTGAAVELSLEQPPSSTPDMINSPEIVANPPETRWRSVMVIHFLFPASSHAYPRVPGIERETLGQDHPGSLSRIDGGVPILEVTGTSRGCHAEDEEVVLVRDAATGTTPVRRLLDVLAQNRWTLGVWIGGVVCLITTLLPTDSPLRVVLVNGASILAVLILLWAAAQMRTDARVVWWWLGAYLLLTVSGDVIYDVYRFHLDEEPFPSVADLFYLLAYVAMIAALGILVHRRQTGRNREVWVDTAVMSLAAACVVATVVVMPVLNDTSAPALTTSIAVAYPLLDVVALSVLIRLLVDVKKMNLALALLTVAIACTLTADLVFQSLAAQGLVEDSPRWVDGLFLAAILLLAAAGTARGASTITRPSPTTQRTKARLVALAAAALTAPTLLAFSVWSEVGSGARLLAVVSIAVILLILWGALMLISLVEQQATLLADLARRDGLTGLPNRRTWDFELDRVSQRTAALGRPLTVAMLDLDHFKEYNDRNGHPAGDDMLVACARAWHSHLEPPAMLARYGGEEFAVLLPGTRMSEALPVLERVRRATPEGQTVSIGCAGRIGDEPIESTVQRADQALYDAKAAGRDRVMASDAAVHSS